MCDPAIHSKPLNIEVFFPIFFHNNLKIACLMAKDGICIINGNILYVSWYRIYFKYLIMMVL